LASERHVIVAGAGIGGLTAALALTRCGFRTTLFEQAPRLEQAGAGIQLGPNASRVLLALGLGPRLRPVVMTPEAIRVMSGHSGRQIVDIPLGSSVERRHGAPYWLVHRGDLQTALATSVADARDIELNLGTRVDDFAAHPAGVVVRGRHGRGHVEEHAAALIGADGVWSSVRERLHRQQPPKFSHRTAWRAILPADAVPPEFRGALVHLWLGLGAHLVHYPVKKGRLINIVGIVHDEWNEQGWSAAGDREEILRHFARSTWSEKARSLIALPERWLKWALHDGQSPFHGGAGPVTLIGDAAHPMLPFLAQGAGMAIEDAAVVADCLTRFRNPADGLREYEAARTARTARAQHMSRKQGAIYGLSGPKALIRDIGMRLLGGERLLARQDWLYSWKPPAPFPGA
jgi:salicylate hydroxylase